MRKILCFILFNFFVLNEISFADDKNQISNIIEKIGDINSSNQNCISVTTEDEESKQLREKKWYPGAKDCEAPGAKIPPFEVHQVNSSYFVIRQNKCINFEAPFLYLFIGEEKAFLLDTGATGDETLMPLRKWIDDSLKNHPKGKDLELIVAHSHSHGDHVAGDRQFHSRPNTKVIGYSPEEVSKAFGISNWPDGVGEVDLGGRKLSILPIPGHEESSVAVYDQISKDLLSGDTLYPGNIFLSESDFGDFKKSVARLHEFSKSHPIRNILGAHIEMSADPKLGYPYGSTYHPKEHRLPLKQENLDELKAYLDSNPRPEDKDFDDFRLTF